MIMDFYDIFIVIHLHLPFFGHNEIYVYLECTSFINCSKNPLFLFNYLFSKLIKICCFFI